MKHNCDELFALNNFEKLEKCPNAAIIVMKVGKAPQRKFCSDCAKVAIEWARENGVKTLAHSL